MCYILFGIFLFPIAGCHLSPDQTIATCCVCLATLLQCVETCWVLLAQIWNWSNFSCNICDVAWCLSRLARFVGHAHYFDFQYPTCPNTSQEGGQISVPFDFIPEYSVLWYAFRKFNNFRIFWNISSEISVPFVPVSRISECLVLTKAPTRRS